ncbi:PAS domain S-box-containing protein/diguanylate cyclase (GGDEF) domain-containing protein [Allopseudospirillum japonicum]|uniref:cyclic-guanylate-specific phosphodiesterase n=1 Tax=Allopseudospirillum japonicum TaxID=64971 RepID=A0A1H6T6P1_9GAMM|nr:EAL domain-containing protein [Allopseudospirillum japonicum]SEI75691.1 PAS domain S-box-containing protein/diguanylate cyclase (GGDEF) domain-containing protein [Allopseudospirillum japonicum]
MARYLSITQKIYLLTLLLVVITLTGSVAFNVYYTWKELSQREYELTFSLSHLLDTSLPEKYFQIIEHPQLENAEKITQANQILQPLVTQLLQAFPGYGAGVYSRKLNAIVAFGPDFNPKGLIDIRPNSPARAVYSTREPLRYDSYSQTRQAQVLAIIRPVIRDQEILGHVWSNITQKSFNNLFYHKIVEQLPLFIFLCLFAVLGSRLITARFLNNLRTFRDRIQRLDLVKNDLRQFSPELLEIYEEVRTSYERLSISEARFRDVVSAFDEYVWEIDLQARYTYLSDKTRELIGQDPSLLVGQNIYERIHADDIYKVRQHIELGISSAQGFRDLEFRRIRHNGQLGWYKNSAVAILDPNTHQVIGLRGATRDVTTNKQQEAQIHYLAYHDALTGLSNRNALKQELQKLCDQQTYNEHTFSLLFIDIDRFKEINDNFGHTLGDKVLQQMAETMRRLLPVNATLARLGGDEFMALLPKTDSNIAEKHALILQKAFSRPLIIQRQRLHISACIGIALAPDDGESPDTLSQSVDTALYTAKVQGPGQIRFCTPQASQSMLEQIRLQHELFLAVKQQQFSLAYQPQLITCGAYQGQVMSMEVLLRWQHPELGFISPARFIPLAEETRLIIELGHWVLKTSCHQVRQWQLEHQLDNLRVAVNISSVQFVREDFVQQVADILEETGLPASCLELEITESVAMEQAEQVSLKLNELKRMGIWLALDDFGTGFSSLKYLKIFPFDILKIDKSFVDGIPHDQQDTRLVEAMIHLAQGQNMQVVAEGVETEEQIKHLSQGGCDLIQGYYFSRPLPPQQTLEFLLEHQLACKTPADNV